MTATVDDLNYRRPSRPPGGPHDRGVHRHRPFSSLAGAVVLWLLTRRGPSGIRRWAVLAVAFGALSALPAFGIDTSIGHRLGLALFHLLATMVVLGVVRQQLGRLGPSRAARAA